MEEIWKDIIGYEGIYQISNKGRVKKFACLKKIGNGAFQPIPEIILKTHNDGKDYIKIDLSKNKIKTSFKIHRLIAIAFIPNPENKATVNHKNGIHNDNRIENLEWMTQSENNFHKYRVLGYKKLTPSGKHHWNSKSVNQLSLNGELIKTHTSISEACRELGVETNNVVSALKGRYHTCGGYKWQYSNSSNKPVKVYSINK